MFWPKNQTWKADTDLMYIFCTIYGIFLSCDNEQSSLFIHMLVIAILKSLTLGDVCKTYN